MTDFTVLGSSVAIFACGSFLTLNKEYDDGIFGKAILIALIFGAGITMAYVVEDNFEPAQSTVLLLVAIALFLLRHCYRFLRWRMDGKFSWGRLKKELKETL